ncbi:SprT-like family-domain-containing protein [Lentinula edodes]|uniref:SprT-like family-domain-containing protein n=1 Tax=Lentinula edodes TaxID=5353 RepID=UPI001E8EDCC3|nr:SprT-like family-domain-containing protein [Lentinula edodes]KAH7881287.1 SprT-like family-domain-containing protein [Lentinula edodes]
MPDSMPQGRSSLLRRTPSLIHNVTPSRSTGKTVQDLRLGGSSAQANKRGNSDINSEIVPDSEEERCQHSESTASKASRRGKNEVVIISSDSEGDEEGQPTDDYSFTVNMPGSWPAVDAQKDHVSFAAGTAKRNSPYPRIAKISRKYRPSRRVIESSDSEIAKDNVNEIIELTDSDEDSPSNFSSRSPFKPTHIFRSLKIPLYADSDHSDSSSPSPLHDEGILVLDDSRNRRKPFLLRNDREEGCSTSLTPQRVVAGRINVAVDVRLTPASAAAMSPSKRQPRMGKKAEATAKLERLKTYALNRFADLNEKVFDNKIPDTTKIEWNCRFTTTAGKASYRRDREGVTHSKIELAIKILDEEQRIDRTLSHEMCHLASWIISEKIDEYHGPIFKGWAAKVERICPGIVVSTTHDYEIKHPWNWKCDFCSYTYGRFTKSIKTEVQGCGACKQGRLIPLFEQPVKRARNPGTPRISRMAASKPRDSPSALARSASPTKLSTTGSSDDGREVVCVHGSESEFEQEDEQVEFDPLDSLVTKMASTNLSA